MDPVNKSIARLSGMVLLVAGLGVATLALWIIARQVTSSAGIQLTVLVGCAIFAIVAVTCVAIGLRLTFNRLNRYQSSLPPLGWYAMAAVFVALGVGLGIVVIRHGEYGQLIGAACTVLFAFWCWKAGRTAAARGRSDAHA